MPNRRYVDQRLDEIGRRERPRQKGTKTNTKLDWLKVGRIRREYAVTNQEWARLFGVSRITIHKVRTGQTWKT